MLTYDDLEVNYVHFSNNEMVGSYEPFLSIIKNCYNKYYSEVSVDEYLNKFEIYELHKSFFKSYIDSDDCERYESFILGEIEFEKQMMLNSVINAIIELSKSHAIIIMIDNAHMIPCSTIKVLKALFDNPDNSNIGIFAAYNDLKNIATVNKKEWISFIKLISTKGNLFEGGAYESGEDEDSSSDFVFESKRAYEYLQKLKAMYCTVELKQANYYLNMIHKKLSREKMNIDSACKFELFKLYAWALTNSGDFTTAILICDKLKEMNEHNNVLQYEYDYYLLLSYIQMYTGKHEQSKKSAAQCRQIAVEMKDELSIFKAEMLVYMIEMSGWYNVYFVVKNIDFEEGFIEKTEKFKYYNHLAHMYIYGYDNDFDEYRKAKTYKYIEQEMTSYRKGISVAEKIGNTSLILKAYRKITMITSAVGNFNTTEHYYEKYTKLLGDENAKELAEIKNGQGYVNCTSRNFEKAMECYEISLGVFLKLGDAKLVGETLYNMSVNCILAEDYNSAYNYLKICVRIIEEMRYNDLRVCNIAKLYGLLALASARLSYEYDTIFYLNTNKKFLDHIINNCTYRDEENNVRAFTGNDDELFLYYFVKGLMEAKDEDYKTALHSYKQAYKHCMNSDGNMFFSYVQLHVAMAEVYLKLEDTANVDKMIKKAYKFASNRNYEKQMKSLEAMRTTGMYEQEKYDLHIEEDVLEQVNELLEKSCVVAQNHNMSSQMDFISAWQNILEITDKTKEELIENAAIAFARNFNLDTFLYIKFNERNAQIMYSDGSVELTEQDLTVLKDYFEHSKSGFVTAKINKNYEDYRKVLEIFGMEVVYSMVCSPFYENEKLDSLFISCIYTKTNWNVDATRYLLNENESGLFSLLLRQLLLAVDKIESIEQIRNINKALKQSSFTDYLTGLNNRKGFYDRVSRLMSESNSEGKQLNLSILYIDLDSFKYYNDTFGHDVGDLVLKEVSDILNYTAGDNGFAIRYGGDEFLIVLEGAGKDEAIATARLTIDTLLSKNGYINEISAFLGKKVVINKEKNCHVLSVLQAV